MPTTNLFNPIIKDINPRSLSSEPCRLKECCRKSILRAVTLKRLKKIKELQEYLPKSLQNYIEELSTSDFQIDAEELGAENHIKCSYPAKCLLDDNKVILKVLSPDTTGQLEFPNFIVSFNEDEAVVCIYHPTESLQDKVHRMNNEEQMFSDDELWSILVQTIEAIMNKDFTPTARITTDMIQVMNNGEVFIDLPNGYDQEQMTVVPMGVQSAVYEAPEVIGRQNPDQKALSWTVGCILHEMLAMEPAFYDKSGVNPFEVFMRITQGKLPDDPEYASDDQKRLIRECLSLNPGDRPNLEQIINICKLNLR